MDGCLHAARCCRWRCWCHAAVNETATVLSPSVLSWKYKTKCKFESSRLAAFMHLQVDGVTTDPVSCHFCVLWPSLSCDRVRHLECLALLQPCPCHARFDTIAAGSLTQLKYQPVSNVARGVLYGCQRHSNQAVLWRLWELVSPKEPQNLDDTLPWAT